MQTNVPRLTCLRCNHVWVPRQTEIRICPNCKSAYWDRPRTPLTPDPYRAIVVEPWSGQIASGQVGTMHLLSGMMTVDPGMLLGGILSGHIVSGSLDAGLLK